MKYAIFLLILSLAFNYSINGQCNKKITWYAAKAEMIDESGQVLDTKQGTIEVESDTVRISVRIKENPNDMLEGKITETTCNWKEAYKNGKSFYKADLTKANGESSKANFTIEGKDGQVIILVEVARMDGKKVKIYVDRWEEKE